MPKITVQIERVTYAGGEDGYTVTRARMKGRRDLITVVGSLPDVSPGEVLALEGDWRQHPRFGEQFKIERYRPVMPGTVVGIEKYLGSGLIHGIGPKMAGRIVRHFGEETLRVIDKDPGRLSEVEGIGKKRIDMIREAWTDQKEIRDIMVFLQSHGVGATHAARIFQSYGGDAVSIIRENPYRLAEDVFGIGFITADRLAEDLGISRDSMLRAGAGILYVLHRKADEGHVCYPAEELIEDCEELLEISREKIEQALYTEIRGKGLVIEPPPAQDSDTESVVFLEKLHFCEKRLSENFINIIRTPRRFSSINTLKAIAWVQQTLSITLGKDQLAGVMGSLESKISIITGGPGTGKTTIIRAMVHIWKRAGIQVSLAAPTGRAAKRMGEATGYSAKTIHRLLEFSPKEGGFLRGKNTPLSCDVLIIDEASMVDTVLMHHLIKALHSGSSLVLVGDIHQLPSVGPGNVLRDLIASNKIPVFELTEIYRQARESHIIVNAHRINEGMMPYFGQTGRKTDFYFREREEPESALAFIRELVSSHIPRLFGFHPVHEVQVLAPMHRGLVGAVNLNTVLRDTLNPDGREIVFGGRRYRMGDKVMQVRNNYEKTVFNGDIGRITGIREETRELMVMFDGRPVVYDFIEMDELTPAYAVSIHKAQGSEYPAVVIPLLTQHYMMLQRNLIYTAVTRGKKLVIIVGSKKALAIGIKNNKTRKRHTRLKDRLRLI